jgi:hypothetical protein
MHVVDPVGVVILIAGVIALVLSTTVIFGRVPARVKAKAWYQESPESWTASVRLFIFVAWTLVLPIYALVKWYFDPPAPADFATFQYGQKVLSDFWTAVTVALGILWGIRRD